MRVLDSVVENYKHFNIENSLDYKRIIEELSEEDKQLLKQEIEVLSDNDVQELVSFFKNTLKIELTLEFVIGFLNQHPELACMLRDGCLDGSFEQDYVRSLFCFYLGIPPWPLAMFSADKKDEFFKALIERSITMNFSFVKQVEA